MAFVEIKESTNYYNFKIGYYTNGSRYIYKEYNYGLTTYKYSSSYMPFLA